MWKLFSQAKTEVGLSSGKSLPTPAVECFLRGINPLMQGSFHKTTADQKYLRLHLLFSFSLNSALESRSRPSKAAIS